MQLHRRTVLCRHSRSADGCRPVARNLRTISGQRDQVLRPGLDRSSHLTPTFVGIPLTQPGKGRAFIPALETSCAGYRTWTGEGGLHDFTCQDGVRTCEGERNVCPVGCRRAVDVGTGSPDFEGIQASSDHSKCDGVQNFKRSTGTSPLVIILS